MNYIIKLFSRKVIVYALAIVLALSLGAGNAFAANKNVNSKVYKKVVKKPAECLMVIKDVENSIVIASQECGNKLLDAVKSVAQLQTELKGFGYYSGPIDGIYGPKTKDAVNKFQKDEKKNLAKDRKKTAGCKLLIKNIENSIVIATQSCCNIRPDITCVTQLQKDLKGLGYYSGPVDGIYGPKTKDAVNNFQNNAKKNLAKGCKKTAGCKLVIENIENSIVIATQLCGNKHINIGINGLPYEPVAQLQFALKMSGYDPGPIDGIYGPRTKAAVERFLNK